MSNTQCVAVNLLSDSEEDSQIYANESRLNDFIRGVELAQRELLRWRNPEVEMPNDKDLVLIKPKTLVGTVVDVATYLNGKFWTIEHCHDKSNIRFWRPIEWK